MQANTTTVIWGGILRSIHGGVHYQAGVVLVCASLKMLWFPRLSHLNLLESLHDAYACPGQDLQLISYPNKKINRKKHMDKF